MIKVYPYNALGHADHGWLDARHHFSFARYWNPQRVGFGTLRVINDDRVQAGMGFGTHPHDNMEIITYVRKGAISHRDSMGNEGRTEAGDVQVMSAGTGVFHSEYNLEPEDTTLYQIWIQPNRRDVTPRWESQQFPKEPVQGSLKVLVSGQAQHAGSDALMIYQDAAIYGGRLLKGTQVTQTIRHQAYVLASIGSITLNGKTLQQGDGAEVTDEKELSIIAQSDAEVIVIDVPAGSAAQH
ncbi:MAG TPA: pirin family protein [Rickettsiales bacterium]|nr:pirin family protein [Rickettsiales bacterium]